MAAPDLELEVLGAGTYPSTRFGKRERKLLETVKAYVDEVNEPAIISAEGDLIVGDSSGDPAALAIGAAGLPLVSDGSTVAYAELTAAGIADAAVSTEHLDSGITFTHRIVAAGSFTTAGGDASETITVAAALNTDLAFVVVKTAGGTPRSIVAAAAGTGSIAVTMSGDPSTDHVLAYQVIRAAT